MDSSDEDEDDASADRCAVAAGLAGEEGAEVAV